MFSGFGFQIYVTIMMRFGEFSSEVFWVTITMFRCLDFVVHCVCEFWCQWGACFYIAVVTSDSEYFIVLHTWNPSVLPVSVASVLRMHSIFIASLVLMASMFVHCVRDK